MKKILTLFLFAALTPISGWAQYAFNVNGFVTDAENGRPLVGVHIRVEGWDAETFTNRYGYYSISVPPEEVRVRFEYNGYVSFIDSIFMEDDLRKDVVLMHEFNYTGEVVGRTMDQNPLDDVQSNRHDLPSEIVQGVPVLVGETDLIKTMQLLPGVDWGNEGFSNLYVRGGDADQNMFYMNGLPVYDQSHAFGLFSVFNPDVLNSVQFHKGNFSARYGGRASSVIDVSTKKGNNDEWEGSAYASAAAFGVTVDGPIGDKVTTSFGFRRTYIDLLFGQFLREAGLDFGYFDLNARVDYDYDENNKFSLFTFNTGDRLGLSFVLGDTIVKDTSRYSQDIGWKNNMVGLNWQRVFSKRLMGDFSLGFSQYRVNIDFTQEVLNSTSGETPTRSIDYSNGIRDIVMSADFDYNFMNNHKINFGFRHYFHWFNTGLREESRNNFPNDRDELKVVGDRRGELSLETSIYVEDEFTVNDRLKLNLGLRAAVFSNEQTTVFRPQPRVFGRYKLGRKTSLKASYGFNAQMMHLLTNEGTGAPTNFWAPATDDVKPVGSHQITLGLINALSHGVEFSVEAYYKKMNNLTLLKDVSATIDPENDWQDQITTGDGSAYGAEFLLYLKQGYLTGWISYTLSRSQRQFQFFSEETFPFAFDRTHMIKATFNYLVTNEYAMNFNVLYGTGRNFTIPTGKYIDVNNQLVLDYQEINNYRSEPYFRIDAGITKESNRDGKGNLIFHANLYNFIAYNNPTNISARRSETNLTQYELVSSSYFRSIPGILLRVEF